MSAPLTSPTTGASVPVVGEHNVARFWASATGLVLVATGGWAAVFASLIP